jgi:hypothetical protein
VARRTVAGRGRYGSGREDRENDKFRGTGMIAKNTWRGRNVAACRFRDSEGDLGRDVIERRIGKGILRWSRTRKINEGTTTRRGTIA